MTTRVWADSFGRVCAQVSTDAGWTTTDLATNWSRLRANARRAMVRFAQDRQGARVSRMRTEVVRTSCYVRSDHAIVTHSVTFREVSSSA